MVSDDQMRNKKDNHLYTDRFNLIVVQLNQENLALDEDIRYGIDKWVKLFKSKTWEELKMVAQGNEYMVSAVKSMYLSNEDYNVIKVAREREEFLRSQAYKERKIASLSAEVASLSNENASLANENTRLRNLLKDNGIDADN